MKGLFAAVGGVITLVGAIPIAIGAAELWERSAHWRAGAHAEGFVISAERLRLRELISPFSRSVYEVFDAGLLLAAGLLIWIGGAVFLWPELRGRRAGPR
jgi:hypothetical protein